MTKMYVFDASTLILLAKTTLLRTFAKTEQVIIPAAVKMEAISKKEAEDAKIISHLLENDNIKQSSEKISSSKLMSDFNIGIGEAEALSLAFKHGYILATDDWRAIKACKILDVKFITAIHCLIYLVHEGAIEQQLAIEKLKKLDYYGRYATEIMKHARKTIEGETNG